MESLGANPQVEGSAVPVAGPFCQVVWVPVDTVTGVELHVVRPAELFL